MEKNTETNPERKVKIRIEGVYKIFGRHPERARKMVKEGFSKEEILEKTGCAVGVADASFDIYEGETLVVMGLSGSGKSTLIRTVNRLIDPTFGKIYIDDEDITAMGEDRLREIRRKKFGMVFQSFALFPHRTVLDNAMFGLEIQGVALQERREKALRALSQVGLAGWEDYYPANLSGGMKQRVGLARALAIEPDVLLMDEAFSALDPLIRTDMQDELLSLESEVHKTILFITHDLDEALKMGDRIVLMKDGKVVQIGTPEEILMNPASDYVAKFVENVDVTKVLTARDVMRRHTPVAFVKDGPRVALHKMKDNGISGIFITRQNHELVGHVTADRAAEAAKREEKWLEHITIADECSTVQLDTPVKDIFPLVSSSPNPIAVVNERNILQGVIVRGSVLAALAEGDNDNE
ncbi:glycine betaine/L-proline ABC transporter ATP-binding protein ProV [Spirochaeta africana]|uniref:Glycine betaine/L-proline transport ATP binding subunit n=1 Tax=Spirochaeta africana (strain ATCC 700263 / DSM 8902 / Z-7692) TaxID=889378 RepID=H9UIA4_SPIAZ|nr:glycine betaine/L-proline ABC transporter ATP-binding protein ProV [Spirochaeta africana]AFG37247.1 glycine betaine/L-proline transport ATP binding subunit [Spirochaeta africana DSM 8902]